MYTLFNPFLTSLFLYFWFWRGSKKKENYFNAPFTLFQHVEKIDRHDLPGNSCYGYDWTWAVRGRGLVNSQLSVFNKTTSMMLSSHETLRHIEDDFFKATLINVSPAFLLYCDKNKIPFVFIHFICHSGIKIKSQSIFCLGLAVA